MGDLCRASGQGRTLWGGLVGGVGAGRWSEGCGDGVGARRGARCALLSLLRWLQLCRIQSNEGERERHSSLSLCPAIKLAIWVCTVIAYWDSVEMCLRAMFLWNEGAQL